MTTIRRNVIYRPHGSIDWVYSDTDYTYSASDTLVYDFSTQNVDGFIVVAESFRIDNTRNGSSIVAQIGARLVKIPAYTDLFNPTEGTSEILVSGNAGQIVTVNIYGRDISASKYVGGRR
jgi:hypothetical protein